MNCITYQPDTRTSLQAGLVLISCFVVEKRMSPVNFMLTRRQQLCVLLFGLSNMFNLASSIVMFVKGQLYNTVFHMIKHKHSQYTTQRKVCIPIRSRPCINPLMSEEWKL